MIIKSMSRSSMSFSSLYDYLTRDSDAELSTHNLYSSAYNRESIVKEFMDNASHLKRSRGKNYLYHEIISLQQSALSLEAQSKILKELSHYYLTHRASEHLSFSALHKDKDHIHMHLMISANTITGNRRIRLSKKEFASIQKNAEQYLAQNYPELEATEHYQREQPEAKKAKSSRSEQELKSRSKKGSKKEELFNTLKNLFEKATSENYFTNALKNREIAFYTRGKTTGVIFEGKKYRLKTLGLQLEYNQLLQKLKTTKTREEKRQKRKTDSKIDARRKEMDHIRSKQYQSKKRERER